MIDKNWLRLGIGFLLVVWLGLPMAPALAKRLPPPEVPPVEYEGIRMTAEDETRCNFVVAEDLDTGERLWRTEVYCVSISPCMEEDVQWRFIEEMEMVDGELRVVNEDGDVYLLDPETGELL